MSARSAALTNVAYGPHPAHRLDVHYPSAVQSAAFAPPLICFVHGGAWRTEDKADHYDLGERIAAGTQCPVAIPNYRLSPRDPTPDTTVLHPAHALDVLHALEFLARWINPPAPLIFDHTRLILIGHSCGAHILTSIFLDSSDETPELTPPPAVVAATRGIMLTEGIYDLDRLITSFPRYRDWFIANAFGDRKDYTPFNTAQYPLRVNATHIRWLIVHSAGDTLVDKAQEEAIFESLHRRTLQLCPATVDTLVSRDLDMITADHHDLFKTESYIILIAIFVSRISFD